MRLLRYQTIARSFAEHQVKQHAGPWNSPLVVFAVVFCLVLATGTLVARELNAKPRATARPGKLAFVPNWQSLAAVGHARGEPAAPVRVVLFADYQCPGCALLHDLLATAADSLQQRLQIVTRHFPLSGHSHARAAANAAECAAQQGRFAAFEDVAYRQQDSIGVLSWEAFGKRAAVPDSAAFRQCVTEERFRTVVEADRSAAQSLKLAGTPVYIVNGQPYFGAPALSELMSQLNAGGRHAK